MITITGGAGFIGSHLAEAIGTDACVVDVVPSPYGTRTIVHDIRKDCADAVSGDVVYHFAAAADVRESALRPHATADVNIMGTLNVLEACRKNDVRTIVFASTSTVYGILGHPAKETDALRPISVYGATKTAAEAIVHTYHALYGIDAVVLRFANIYGPRSRRGVIHDFIAKLRTSPDRLEILGDGAQNKSYLFIDDAVRATLLAAHQRGFSIFNVGSNDQVTVTRIAGMVSAELALAPSFSYTGLSWPGDVPNFLLDTTKIKTLGWSPTVDLAEGIHRYVGWLGHA